MKKNLILMLLLGLTLAGHAQQTASPRLLFDMGYAYLKGLHKPYDPEKAFTLFQQSATADFPRAMNAMGNMYLKGTGTQANVDSAVYWYEKAAGKGYKESWLNLGRIYQEGRLVKQDFEEAARYFEAGAKAGDWNCLNMVAYFHFKGLGLRQDYTAAFNIYKELAEKGHINALYFLGICYRNGYGTPANPELAKEWLAKAAERNDKQSTHELYEEELPENKSVISDELQRRVAQLKNYQEQFIASNNNNLSGYYKGYAVYYDFSGKYVNDIVPLSLHLTKTANGYAVNWKEGDSLSANLKAALTDNNFRFDSTSQYVRNNYYSHHTNERFQFNNASLDLKYLNDSIYLSGEVRFYSLKRREPAQPMYIALSRVLDNTEKSAAGKLAFRLSPNPASAYVKVSFTLAEARKVQLQLISSSGSVLQQIPPRLLPAGSYSFNFELQGMPAGSYIIRAQAGEKVISTTSEQFIKQ